MTINSVEPVITGVIIGKGKFNSSVKVTYGENLEYVHLFDFYHDEISFTGRELAGLTKQQAHELFHKKDVAYLRS
jgi:hypothetical protein